MQQAPTEPMLSTDEETRQSKCMRLHSPPQPARRTSAIPRASSAVLPSRVNYRSILCATNTALHNGMVPPSPPSP